MGRPGRVSQLNFAPYDSIASVDQRPIFPYYGVSTRFLCRSTSVPLYLSFSLSLHFSSSLYLLFFL